MTRRVQISTFGEIVKEMREDESLDPIFKFRIKAQHWALQDAHVASEDLIRDNPAWEFALFTRGPTTHEGITIFQFLGSEEERDRLIAWEENTNPYEDPDTLWVTPVGHYREQYT